MDSIDLKTLQDLLEKKGVKLEINSCGCCPMSVEAVIDENFEFYGLFDKNFPNDPDLY